MFAPRASIIQNLLTLTRDTLDQGVVAIVSVAGWMREKKWTEGVYMSLARGT